MANTTSVNLRIDKDLKNEAEALFSSLGMNMTTAITVFLKQSVRNQGLPFRISAIKEMDYVPVYKGNANQFSTYDEFIADSLRSTDMMVAEGGMKYYTADEIRSGLEELLNEKL